MPSSPPNKKHEAGIFPMLVTALLDWFRIRARDLPWRRTHDPYAIWVSEIMLQQTQVKTVIPYWERWLSELPTIESLANASSEKIHKLWEGLGYYTRVRNMQKTAREIVEKSGKRKAESGNDSCKFPQNFDDVLALPGIGRYTAGAICSIAFNQPTPILDGNVIRVLTRAFGITTNPREKQTNAQLWQLAGELVAHASHLTPHVSACSRLNQSLMELGALICAPRSPQCGVCPVQKFCIAHKKNLQERLPNLGKRAATTERRFLAFVVERDGKYLVRQRPAGIVNAHLWEFPNIEVVAVAGRVRPSVRAATGSNPNGAQRTDTPYRADDFRPTSVKPFCTIKHSITRYRITLEAWRADLANLRAGAPISRSAGNVSTAINAPGRRAAPPGSWLTLAQLRSLAFTSAHKKILGLLEPLG